MHAPLLMEWNRAQQSRTIALAYWMMAGRCAFSARNVNVFVDHLLPLEIVDLWRQLAVIAGLPLVVYFEHPRQPAFLASASVQFLCHASTQMPFMSCSFDATERQVARGLNSLLQCVLTTQLCDIDFKDQSWQHSGKRRVVSNLRHQYP
jgi:hypothetical protein